MGATLPEPENGGRDRSPEETGGLVPAQEDRIPSHQDHPPWPVHITERSVKPKAGKVPAHCNVPARVASNVAGCLSIQFDLGGAEPVDGAGTVVGMVHGGVGPWWGWTMVGMVHGGGELVHGGDGPWGDGPWWVGPVALRPVLIFRVSVLREHRDGLQAGGVRRPRPALQSGEGQVTQFPSRSCPISLAQEQAVGYQIPPDAPQCVVTVFCTM